jgi:hypothetical protein
MKTPDIFDLYTDYLITSFSHTTSTGLSGLVDNAISHDPVTRFLSQQDLTSKEHGKLIKKTVREIETGGGVLIDLIKTPRLVSISLTVFLITFPSSLEVKSC